MTKKIQLLMLTVAVATFISCNKNEQDIITPQSTESTVPDYSENGTNPDEAGLTDEKARPHSKGYIYIAGNEAGTNQIHIFKQHAGGNLTHEGTVASGGKGNGASLGSQGALALSNNNDWLFAVNAGDNSISSFRVNNDGSLTLAGNEISGGTIPVSICVYGNYVYVVNAGTSNIKGYTIDGTGKLTGIAGSNHTLSSLNAGPAQIAFSPDGDYLYVTEKITNNITSFVLDANGRAMVDKSFPSTGNTPFGFSIARDHFMVVANANGGAQNGSSCTSYSGINSANLVAVNGAVPNNQTAACWVATTKHGRFAYVTNTGSNNISSYYVAPWGSLYLVHSNAAPGNGPADICVAANNYYVYTINSGNHTIGGYHRAFLGDLVPIGTTSGLPDFAAGLVAL